ncbi:MAG TPA: BstXI family restriction endonuclease [Solirubrobacterales bacterium]
MADLLPKLPGPVERKLYKTGQTRGATTSLIYQNRVLRNSTVLIPYAFRDRCAPPEGEAFEKGGIVLVRPAEYFDQKDEFEASGLRLGHDALLFYETRPEWERWRPDAVGLGVARSRLDPLGGEFVARIPGTTGAETPPIREGFTATNSRGAGIRVYEYASARTIARTRLHLEALMWSCHDAIPALGSEMGIKSATARKQHAERTADFEGLLDRGRMASARMINSDGHCICPLCLEPMSAEVFAEKIRQAEGRAKVDNTVTETSLFHIDELRLGEYGHRPYNVGWGHHHCNVVAKDAGIAPTLEWMSEVLDRNLTDS